MIVTDCSLLQRASLDARLSPVARGVIVLAIACGVAALTPDDLRAQGCSDREARRTLQELATAGYVEFVREKTADGRYKAGAFHVRKNAEMDNNHVRSIDEMARHPRKNAEMASGNHPRNIDHVGKNADMVSDHVRKNAEMAQATRTHVHARQSLVFKSSILRFKTKTKTKDKNTLSHRATREGSGLPFHIANGFGVTGQRPGYGEKADQARQHPLVRAFMSALPEGARPPVDAAYLDVAEKLARDGYTPTHVAGLVASKIGVGKVDYAFRFLPQDLPAWRYAQEHTPAPTAAAAPPRASPPQRSDSLLDQLIADEFARLPDAPPPDFMPSKPADERARSWALTGRKGVARQRAKDRLATQGA
jgi:hypothetical protein